MKRKNRSLTQSLLKFNFNNTATTEINTLSLHDALPISKASAAACTCRSSSRESTRSIRSVCRRSNSTKATSRRRSEEHTSELQSHVNLVCRLLLEKKKLVRFSLLSFSLVAVLRSCRLLH